MMYTHDSFAKRLNEAMFRSKIDLTKLSKLSSVQQSTIETYLDGAYVPEHLKLDRLAKVLDVRSSWLLGYNIGDEIETFCMSATEDLTVDEFEAVKRFIAEIKASRE